jgi:hypothetical protein
MIVAGIGSRSTSPEEGELIAKIGTWLGRRGIHLRSGGAKGADQAWAAAVAAVNPALVTVCVQDDADWARGRAPEGVQTHVPPYPHWMVELAVAEWEFGDGLSTVGLPPYQVPAHARRFEDRKSWRYFETHADVRKRGTLPLMVRNVAIIVPEEGRPVNAVFGFLNPEQKGGGGTGHGFRLAQALGVPTFNLRDPLQLAGARAALLELEQGRAPAVSPPAPLPAVTTTPAAEQTSLFGIPAAPARRSGLKR